MTTDPLPAATATVRTPLEIHPNDRAFDGHFPGDPAFPGVGQLWRGLAATPSPFVGAVSTGVRKVRFRSPIGPGAHLAVALSPIEGTHEFRFELRNLDADDEGVVSEAILGFGEARAPLAVSANEIVSSPAPARHVEPERILPHRGPARMLDSVISIGSTDEESWVRGRVPAHNFLVEDGRVSVVAALELASQAGPVVDEVRKPEDEPIRQLEGFLAGVRQATFDRPSFDVEDELVAAIRTSARARFVTVNARVFTRRDDSLTPLATAEVQLLVTGS